MLIARIPFMVARACLLNAHNNSKKKGVITVEHLLEDYPVITEIPVAWGDMDALQHVNNVVYFRYFESARIDYFGKMQMMEQAKGSGIGPVISHTQCFYKVPVTYPDTLLVGSRVRDVQEDRFTMEYAIFSKSLNKVTTTGTATGVMFNFLTNRKTSIPEEVKAHIQTIEAGGIASS
ncbi:acyl-CoA thioesterase [Endozoicomonas sp. GU-1]|uniref:acyl-CoA thioesterase n=2 Tax=Endozoicomonas sp. GU-1 TaxID=3009078 RepID=UPI0022B50925|nr:thioesterase family protein [Endozoicomonas sp. GU-1]WBA86468.1 thioesterase family protein [Endozoicomonas sp. GU-1]